MNIVRHLSPTVECALLTSHLNSVSTVYFTKFHPIDIYEIIIIHQAEMYSVTLQSLACLSENRELCIYCIFLEMVCNTIFSAFSYLDNNKVR